MFRLEVSASNLRCNVLHPVERSRTINLNATPIFVQTTGCYSARCEAAETWDVEISTGTKLQGLVLSFMLLLTRHPVNLYQTES